jgi:hypothetical protein
MWVKIPVGYHLWERKKKAKDVDVAEGVANIQKV